MTELRHLLGEDSSGIIALVNGIASTGDDMRDSRFNLAAVGIY